MHLQSQTCRLALLSALGAASCASAPQLERQASLVQPSAELPAAAEPSASPSTAAVSPLDDDGDDDRWWLERILFGPTRAPHREVRSLDPRMDEERWWIERPTAAERAQLAGLFRAEEGWYLGPLYAFTHHADKDLDGQKFITGLDTIVLPEIDVGSGPGVVFGYRFETTAFEISYLRTDHDARWLGNDLNVTYESFGIDFKQFFFTDQRLQPFLVLGFSVPTLEIENGSFSGVAVGDATLEDDFAAEVGAGLGLYLTPRIFLGSHGVYRFAESYDEAEGVTGQAPSTSVEAGGFLGAITLTFTL